MMYTYILVDEKDFSIVAVETFKGEVRHAGILRSKIQEKWKEELARGYKLYVRVHGQAPIERKLT